MPNFVSRLGFFKICYKWQAATLAGDQSVQITRSTLQFIVKTRTLQFNSAIHGQTAIKLKNDFVVIATKYGIAVTFVLGKESSVFVKTTESRAI